MRTFKTPLARAFNDAATQYLEVSSSPVSAAPITLAAWFLSDDITVTQTLISLCDSGAVNFRNTFSLEAAGAVASDPVRARTVNNTGTNAAAATSTGFLAGQWHHAAGVFAAGNDRRAYLDGGGKGTNSTSSVPAAINVIGIGRVSDASPDSYMSGQIVWPTIWNIALSDDEVFRLSRGAHPYTVRPEAIVAFWDWTGAAGTEFGLRGTYPLTNSGSVPVNGPGFLAQPVLPRRRRFNSVAAATSRLLNLRRRAVA